MTPAGAAAAIAVLLLSTSAEARTDRPIYEVNRPSETCLVVAVSDGDTLKVRCGQEGNYRQITVRISEIDAPEKKQPFGQRSKESLSKLCFQAQAVVTPETRDKYGRTVARVSCGGQDVSLHQARTGMAWFYVKYGRDVVVRDAEQSARAGRVGLWADAEPVAPWEFRHAGR